MAEIPDHVGFPEGIPLGIPYLFVFKHGRLVSLGPGSFFVSPSAGWTSHPLAEKCVTRTTGRCWNHFLWKQKAHNVLHAIYTLLSVVARKSVKDFSHFQCLKVTKPLLLHGLFLYFMCFEFSKAVFITSVFAFSKQNICYKTVKKYCLLLFWLCQKHQRVSIPLSWHGFSKTINSGVSRMCCIPTKNSTARRSWPLHQLSDIPDFTVTPWFWCKKNLTMLMITADS